MIHSNHNHNYTSPNFASVLPNRNSNVLSVALASWRPPEKVICPTQQQLRKQRGDQDKQRIPTKAVMSRNTYVVCYKLIEGVSTARRSQIPYPKASTHKLRAVPYPAIPS